MVSFSLWVLINSILLYLTCFFLQAFSKNSPVAAHLLLFSWLRANVSRDQLQRQEGKKISYFFALTLMLQLGLESLYEGATELA